MLGWIQSLLEQVSWNSPQGRNTSATGGMEVAMGDQPGVGKGVRREKLLGCYWGHRVDVNPALALSIVY